MQGRMYVTTLEGTIAAMQAVAQELNASYQINPLQLTIAEQHHREALHKEMEMLSKRYNQRLAAVKQLPLFDL